MTRELSALCVQVAHWRKHREGGSRSRVPECLWNAAVAVARVEGVYATSRAAGFGYCSLKERLERAGCAAPQRKPDRSAAFVEVQLPSSRAVCPGESSAEGQTVVEFMGTGGARMRIGVTGTSRVDVVGLAQAFWSREP